MLDRKKTLVPVSPFSGLPSVRTRTVGNGVRISTYDSLCIATVLARKDQESALAERVRQSYRISLPQALGRSSTGGIAFIATGPQSWLATAEQSDHAFPISLRQTIGDLASISDQSDGYAVLRLAGPKVRETLAKLVPIDVHPRVFPIDMAVVTVAAHIGVTLWRIADEPEGTAAFELAFYRSMAGSCWHALCESAAEFGVESSTAQPAHELSRHAIAVGSRM